MLFCILELVVDLQHRFKSLKHLKKFGKLFLLFYFSPRYILQDIFLPVLKVFRVSSCLLNVTTLLVFPHEVSQISKWFKRQRTFIEI